MTWDNVQINAKFELVNGCDNYFNKNKYLNVIQDLARIVSSFYFHLDIFVSQKYDIRTTW